MTDPPMPTPRLPISLDALFRQRAMRSNGSPPPEFETDEDRSYFLVRLPVHERAKRGTPQVTPQVERLLSIVEGALLREELQERLGIGDRKYFRTEFLAPAMEAGFIEMTLPNKPNSSKQRYRLTASGESLRAQHGTKFLPDYPQALLKLGRFRGTKITGDTGIRAEREISAALEGAPSDRRLREELLSLKQRGLVEQSGHGRGSSWSRRRRAE